VRFVKKFSSFSGYTYTPGTLRVGAAGPLPTTPATPATDIQYEGYYYEPPKENQLTYPINIRISQENK